MTIDRMTGPDCAGMCNLINKHTHTYTHVEGKQEVAACVQRRPSSVEANLTGKERNKLLVLLIC